MKHLDKIACLFVVLQLSACTYMVNLLHKEEAKEALFNEKPAHAVGVGYDVVASTGDRKQVSMFFNGKGLARLLDPAGGNIKTIIDYDKQLVSTKDFDSDSELIKKLDPYAIPCVLNARAALANKATCVGLGIIKGFPYHRWSRHKGEDEWEIWTDDNDSFPIYFRSIKGGEVCTWTIINAWVDESTVDKPTFYTLEADPPPPEWVKAQAEEKEKAKREAELALQKEKERQKRKHRRVAHRAKHT